MKAGRETDARVAMNVMGWLPHARNTAHWTDAESVNATDYKVRGIVDQWAPSTDISAAWEVVEKLRSEGWLAVVKDMPDGFPYYGPDDIDPQPKIYTRACAEFSWMPRSTLEDTRKYIFTHTFSMAETPALAICKAALKVRQADNA